MVCNLFNKCAYFSDSDNIPKSYIVFNKSNLVECINYLIDNAFVVFNNHVYRQVIGIPMGTNSGPHVANIYPHFINMDGIPTKFLAVGIPYLGARNPHRIPTTRSRHHRKSVGNRRGGRSDVVKDLETEDMSGYSYQGLGNPGMCLKADHL